jgi:hypothetical protein
VDHWLWFCTPLLGYGFLKSIMTLLELALRHERNRARKFRERGADGPRGEESGE